MINQHSSAAVPGLDDADSHEYHLKDVCAANNNNQHGLLLRSYRKIPALAIAVAVGLLLATALTATIIASNNRKFARNQQVCPNEVERWVYYNGAYFSYYLYLQQWPNPDPKILILKGGGYMDENGDDPNEFSYGQGCSMGGWSVEYGYADGSSFSYGYSVPEDARNGGTFSMGGVEYDLKNNGSVFLLDSKRGNEVTQLNGLDLSSLVIDKETMSIASVTEFCYSNQEILDFFDNSRANAGND